MRTLAITAALVAALSAASAQAHDFWVQPFKFQIEPNSTVLTSLQVGHGKDRQRWDSDASRVVQFTSTGPKGVNDLRKTLRAGPMTADHPLAFGAPGTYLLALETSHAESTLPGLRFQDYLKQEGLTPALELRARTRAEARPGREIYSRRAKALVLVGPPSATPQPWVTRPLGLTLEIVPETNPYAPGAPGELAVRVYYQGRLLPGATVMLNNLQFDGRPVQTLVTDAAGRAVVKFPRTGDWQLNVIWTRPLLGNRTADFDTTFSSLTFGFPPRSPAGKP